MWRALWPSGNTSDKEGRSRQASFISQRKPNRLMSAKKLGSTLSTRVQMRKTIITDSDWDRCHNRLETTSSAKQSYKKQQKCKSENGVDYQNPYFQSNKKTTLDYFEFVGKRTTTSRGFVGKVLKDYIKVGYIMLLNNVYWRHPTITSKKFPYSFWKKKFTS